MSAIEDLRKGVAPAATLVTLCKGGDGWEPIPHGMKGGTRRRRADGGYDYRYKGSDMSYAKMAKHHAQDVLSHHEKHGLIPGGWEATGSVTPTTRGHEFHLKRGRDEAVGLVRHGAEHMTVHPWEWDPKLKDYAVSMPAEHGDESPDAANYLKSAPPRE
jgi:hypothetical protein